MNKTLLSCIVILLFTACSDQLEGSATYPNTFLLENFVEQAKQQNLRVKAIDDKVFYSLDDNLSIVKLINRNVATIFYTGIHFNHKDKKNNFANQLSKSGISFKVQQYMKKKSPDSKEFTEIRYIFLINKESVKDAKEILFEIYPYYNATEES